MRTRWILILFIIIALVVIFRFIPVFEKNVYLNISKGVYLEKTYFLKIKISSKYEKNPKIEKTLKEVGLFKDYDDYLFLYGYQSFLFHATQRLTGPYRLEFLLTNFPVRQEDAFHLLKAIQDRNYARYQLMSNKILENSLSFIKNNF